ncbi:MAG: SCO family protein [Phycisphaeraceae bacterium]|nr:SCO family protein [Phycisphaeraceae bacterium]
MFPRRTSTNARFAAAAAVCALALCGPARAGDEEPDLRPKPVRGLELKNRLGASVPRDLVFTDSTGKQVALGSYFPRQVGESGAGRPVVMTLIYYKCPVMCPTLMEKLTDALNTMDFTVGSEYDVLVVSFDGRDSAQDAAREKAGQLMYYARPTDDTIRAGWNYLVTQPENVRVLADAVGFPYRYLPSAGEYSHGPVVMVLTPDGRVSRYFTGFEDPAKLPKDLRLALVEASGGRIGTTFDRLFLWCYHWNPEDGTYSLQAMRVMQIGGILSMLAVGSTVGTLLVQERRRRRKAGAAGGAGRAAAAGTTGLKRGGFELSGQAT